MYVYQTVFTPEHSLQTLKLSNTKVKNQYNYHTYLSKRATAKFTNEKQKQKIELKDLTINKNCIGKRT